MAETKQARRQRAFRQLFLTPNGTVPEGYQKIVLQHLATFCEAAKPPTRLSPDGRIDPLATMQVIGRQEVWQMIQAHLNLPIQDVTLFGHGVGDIPNI